MNLPRQFLRYGLVGATGTLLHYAVLWGGVKFLGSSAALASGAGYLAGSVVNYLLHYLITFQSHKPHAEAVSKYYFVLGIGWCINTGLMTLLAHHRGQNYWLPQIFSTVVSIGWNFIGNRWWTFNHATPMKRYEDS